MDEQQKEEFWQDIGRPEEVSYRFTVTVLNNGSVTTTPEPADEINRLSRTATPYDVYQACSEIVLDLEHALLADRIAKIVLSAMKPQDSAAALKEKLLSALSDRGIETPKP
jgi:hypothetical protein